MSCGKTSASTGGRIKRLLQLDIEALLLSACTVVGEIEAFLDQGVNIDKTVLARAFARMQQHVLDDGIRALAMLFDLAEIVPQRAHQFGDSRPTLVFV